MKPQKPSQAEQILSQVSWARDIHDATDLTYDAIASLLENWSARPDQTPEYVQRAQSWEDENRLRAFDQSGQTERLGGTPIYQRR